MEVGFEQSKVFVSSLFRGCFLLEKAKIVVPTPKRNLFVEQTVTLGTTIALVRWEAGTKAVFVHVNRSVRIFHWKLELLL